VMSATFRSDMITPSDTLLGVTAPRH
jgi:hypothetical protein